MRNYKWVMCLVGAIAFLGQAAPSYAGTVLSFGYTDMSGDFFASNANSGSFEAHDDGDTSGDVTRILGPAGTALFAGSAADGGFPAPAAVDVYIDVTNITDTGADGVGTIRLTDSNGDYIEALIGGLWFNVAGAGNFNGFVAGVSFVNGSGDGTFDGTTDSISMDFAEFPYSGNIQTLTFQDWFNDSAGGAATDFGKSNTLVHGAIVPEPATLALLAMGGLALVSRRRRS